MAPFVSFPIFISIRVRYRTRLLTLLQMLADRNTDQHNSKYGIPVTSKKAYVAIFNMYGYTDITRTIYRTDNEKGHVTHVRVTTLLCNTEGRTGSNV
jgi:hypothetical protein